MTEASAKTYRLAKNLRYAQPQFRAQPFDLSANTTSQAFLTDVVQSLNGKNLQNMAGKLPGSWSLPVCDGSTWGGQWNYNINQSETIPRYTFGYPSWAKWSKGSPPCICGKSLGFTVVPRDIDIVA